MRSIAICLYFRIKYLYSIQTCLLHDLIIILAEILQRKLNTINVIALIIHM